MKRLLAPGLALVAATALAAPPPGHPSPGEAMDILMPEKAPAPSELPNRGKVIGSIDANAFTYIEVERDGAREWIAVQKMVVRPGDAIRYEDGAVMTNFYSKLLQRTFPSVMFVGHVAVGAD